MKGGGLTWAGWLMVGVGGLLVFSGMTGQSLVGELSAVLGGKGLTKGQGATPSNGAMNPADVPKTAPAPKGSANSIENDLIKSRALPNTVLP